MAASAHPNAHHTFRRDTGAVLGARPWHAFPEPQTRSDQWTVPEREVAKLVRAGLRGWAAPGPRALSPAPPTLSRQANVPWRVWNLTLPLDITRRGQNRRAEEREEFGNWKR